MLWTEEKLAARIRELDPFRYRDERDVTAMLRQFDTEGRIAAYPPEEGEWEPVQIGDRWTGRDLYMWLAFEADIPATWAGKKILGRFDFGRTGGGGNSGFESLLFLNGEPYQGVDTNHGEVFLPPDAAGTTVGFRFRLWSGLNGYGPAAPIEHRLRLAKLCWLDEAADDLFYTARAALQTVERLGEHQPERHELLSALDRAFLLIDWSSPGSEPFYASLEAARDLLRQQLDDISKHHPVTVRCIGHTHIDVAWLWRLKHTREKVARSFSTVLRLMELYPDYVFLQTQPQLYEYLQTDYPALYEQIRERIAEGRWEAGGAMWLEADCNLTSGESLVRQLLYGTRFFREQFGVECRYLWLPDVFGYSWALPQILKKSGIDMFMTTKISWNQYNRMPHDTFRWRGIDGSEVLTHFITTPDPGGNEGAFYYTYNGSITPDSVQGIWEGYRDKELNRHLLLSYGYGDGGGGVNREMLEMRRRLESMPGLPHVTTGRVDEYFAELQERMAATDRYVHTWDGELYLELHRGTYTSQAYNKRANRKLELLYRETEWLSVLTALHGAGWSSYPQSRLYEGWKIILRNQFHDIIPGSSIGEVYEDCREEYAEAFGIGCDAWIRAAEGLIPDGASAAGHPLEAVNGTLAAAFESVSPECAEQVSAEPGAPDVRYVTLFNGASWERTDTVRLTARPGMEQGCWRDEQGHALASQRSGGDWLVNADGLPSMGYAVLQFEAGSGRSEAEPEAGTGPFRIGTRSLSTPFYDIEWNEQGQLTRLFDKAAEREVLAQGQAGNVLQVFEDKPKGRHEAWDIDIFYREKMETIIVLTRAEVTETGPVRAVVRFEWTYRNSTVVQDMILYAASRRIDFATNVDWHEQRKLLKVAFPVDIRATEATYDIQFGNVKRPTHWNTSWDYARFETVGHQWADLSERNYGVSLLNDCKYGYDIKDNVIRLSLIKSAMVPDPRADQGEHRFTYALLPHEGDWHQGRIVQEAWSLNNPVTAVYGKPERSALSLLSLPGDASGHVMIDAIKRAEDREAVVVRLHEFGGIRGEVKLASDLPIEAWQELDLMERPAGERQDGSAVAFAIKPYEIKTLLLQMNGC
ncbi:alpha-mannosidase [Paenibacillus tyrfis]|uniref:alpha-mannosidase n=1 Tax=Paenibacillus tyrfis TaxID=1501230 RepID=UPI0020A1AB8D|nr:alpha-mannosidase [Paenibacillus tyrfis]MCP1311141.1 alpha-mannosidase [Paenibacillus tyrfis]